MRSREALEAVAAGLRVCEPSGDPATMMGEAQRLRAAGLSVVETMFVVAKAFDVSLGDAEVAVVSSDASGALMAELSQLLDAVEADPRFRPALDGL
ncbi:hypothetical protein [Oerskovia sp. KBS0722]|uniref:hypothetical protein n=1 Tax=Oerskovia sp. KBS0722 TaxID=1179673 RepID=UPI00110E749C|nr:hypothetical protein [Oerskovia sp. KBS0722]QDW62904.1 hypothetical protein FFI11_010515 [Oerskovia sp. KBS0722]